MASRHSGILTIAGRDRRIADASAAPAVPATPDASRFPGPDSNRLRRSIDLCLL